MKSSAAKVIGRFVLVAVAMAIGAAATYRWPAYSALTHSAGTAAPDSDASPVGPSNNETIQRAGRDELVLPATVAERMGLHTAAAACATHSIKLPSFQGVLALDSDRLSRVHSRFAGEVVEVGRSTDGSDPPLRVGERVQSGDLLAVVWSTELGKKKSELVDALTKLRAEEQLRDRLKKLFEDGAGAGRNFRDAEKDVQARQVEIASLERTLRTWRMTDDDIAAVRAEATRLTESQLPSADQSRWARVEVRAPMSGVILEKNVVVGDIVDTTTDLFKIGQLSTLSVWVHVYEEDLPLIEALPQPVAWTITIPSRPGYEFVGTLDKVGAVIDSAQHTALVMGRVENPAGDLKVGQFVTVTVQLPPSVDEIELPSNAVVEDGRQSIVFVQPSQGEQRFVRRPVRVIRRFHDEIYVKASTDAIQPGDHIVTAGALLLQNAIEQLAAPSDVAVRQLSSPNSPPPSPSIENAVPMPSTSKATQERRS
jgi:membrane fusion protein, heavy metal efflux system